MEIVSNHILKYKYAYLIILLLIPIAYIQSVYESENSYLKRIKRSSFSTSVIQKKRLWHQPKFFVYDFRNDLYLLLLPKDTNLLRVGDSIFTDSSSCHLDVFRLKNHEFKYIHTIDPCTYKVDTYEVKVYYKEFLK